MSHPTTIGHVLWGGIRKIYRDLRRLFASSEEHSGPALVVDATLPEVRAVLGRRSFAPNWEFSYYERGEELNLARVVYDVQECRGHEYVWWQTHVRGWPHDDETVRLRAHYELEPTEYDQDHINGIGVDVDRGTEVLATVLDEAGLAYDRYEQLPVDGES